MALVGLVRVILMITDLFGHHLGHDPGECLEVLAPAALWSHYRTYLLVDADRTPRTVSAYRHVIYDWFGYLEGLKPPRRWNRATGKDLTRFLDRPTRSGRAKGQRLAANTRLHYAHIIKGLYTFAHEAELIRRNPMAKVKLPKGGQPIARGFDQRQLREILLTAELVDDRLYVMCALAYGAGLRAAEIASVRIEDIHLEQRGWLLVHGKGRKDRAIPLVPEVRAALIRMLADRGMPRVGPLGVSRGVRPGRPMTPGSVSRALSDFIRKQCQIDGSGHGLRHTFAQTLIAEAGEDKLLTVSQLLGHETTGVTERVYLRGYRGLPEQVIDKVPFPTRRASR